MHGPGWTRMNAPEAAVARAFLDERRQQRRHVVISLSGAHAYGFPSPDSDLDLKALHLAPTRAWLGFGRAEGAVDFLGVIDGIEVDYTSNELGGALQGALKGNGNYLERLLGGCALYADPLLDGLQPVVRANLSRRVAGHYRGFARALHLRLSEPGATWKHVLYVLRSLLTGVHLLRTGEVQPDLSLLCDDHGFGQARAWIAAKRAGERTPLPPAALAEGLAVTERAFAALDAAVPTSILPAEPADPAALEAWLVEARLGMLST